MYSIELADNQVLSVDAEQAMTFFNAGMTVYKTTLVPVTKDELEQAIAAKNARSVAIMAQPENTQSMLITPAK